MSDMFSTTSCVIITGAGGGYGSALASTIISHLQAHSLLVLSSRNKSKLSEVKTTVSSLATKRDVNLAAVACDLSQVEDIHAFYSSCQSIVDISKIKSAMLINNAGSLGKTTHIDRHEHLAIKEHMDLNVTNTLYFTKKFLDFFASKAVEKCIVNISSLFAITPVPSCSLYCTAKAARDMMFKVLAIERKDITVLSWAPGPMHTEMLVELSKSGEESVSVSIATMIADKSCVECRTSAEKLFKLLKSGNFTSGDHIDFYDVQ